MFQDTRFSSTFKSKDRRNKNLEGKGIHFVWISLNKLRKWMKTRLRFEKNLEDNMKLKELETEISVERKTCRNI